MGAVDDNPVIQAIRTRRSVRRYRDTPIPGELLETLVDCGRLAPSASNLQSWEFVVVTDPEVLTRISELATYGKFVKDAPACIVISGNPKNRSVYLDGAAAAENILLAAHALGLASCWVQALDKPYNAPIKELLAIPDEQVLVAILPIAYPEGDTPRPPKRGLQEVLHWGRF